uniref:Uncharacterized protein n=1 Tax=Ciona savignyi TaxID=51511 RepID=H2YYP8_CIOSA
MLSNIEKSPQSENSRTHQIPQTNSTKTGSIAKEVTSVASSKPPLTIGAVFPSNLASLDNGKLLNQNTCPPEPALKNGKRIPQNSCVSEPALSTSGDSWTTATSPGRYKDPQQAPKNLSSGEDIVERVLRRYGIQKASTLPPLPRQPAPPSSNESSATVQQETSSNGSGDNITPRSQALLDQLKDQLLQ